MSKIPSKHKKNIQELNSTITIFGEWHNKDYSEFLTHFIDYLYDDTRKKIIIVEKNENELPETDKMALMFMKPIENKEVELIRKKMLIKIAQQPITYFVNANVNLGIFPNSQIVYGDNRLHIVILMQEEIENSIEDSPDDIIPEEILVQFFDVWHLQRLVMVGDEYSEYKLLIINLLMEIRYGITYIDIEIYLNLLAHYWLEISNISIISKLNEVMCSDCDFYILVGDLHVDSIVERINSLYEGPDDTPMIKDKETHIVEDIDITNPKYKSYWFNDPVFKIVDYIELKLDEEYYIRFRGSIYNKMVRIKKLYETKFEYENIMENNIIEEHNYKNTFFYKYRT